MKLSLGLLGSALAGLALADRPIAGYTFSRSERPNTTKQTQDLTPKEFRLVLAQQLGLSQYHNLADGVSDIDSETLETINRLGYGQKDLFSEEDSTRLFLVLHGSDEEWETTRRKFELVEKLTPAFALQDSPGRHFESLLKDVADQSAASGRLCDDEVLETARVCKSGEHVPVVSVPIASLTEASKADSAIDYSMLLDSILESNTIDATILLVSDSSLRAPSGVFKQKAAHPWGRYTKAGSKRPGHLGERQSEAPMSDSVVDQVFGNSAEATPEVTKPEASPLRKIPLVCHASLEACQEATNSCSGHGECYRKYGPVSGDSGPTCFACGCKPTYSKETGTTYWGGAACQKRDISAQFWIISGFSLLLMGLVGWAIGMMFSIGNEKLPGVIGAGVAPKTR